MERRATKATGLHWSSVAQYCVCRSAGSMQPQRTLTSFYPARLWHGTREQSDGLDGSFRAAAGAIYAL